MNQKENIPIFFSVDNSFAPYLIVCLTSLIKNSSEYYHYTVHVLYTDLRPELIEAIEGLSVDHVEIKTCDAIAYARTISDRLPIRDYYSAATYYRLFIAEMFPQYDKVLYLDADTIILGNVADLYHTDIGDNYVGACNELVMAQVKECGDYVEQCLGIDRNLYFNAGVLVINAAKFREKRILERFFALLNFYDFKITQDEDYLNVLCKDHVKLIKQVWDVETFMETIYSPSEFKIVHYIMATKPWHFHEAKFSHFFWDYAKLTPYYERIKENLEKYSDSHRKRDLAVMDNILEACRKEIASPDNYLRKLNRTRDQGRVKILEKIAEYERLGKFDKDVEDDPPGRMIKPGEVDYLRKKPISKLKSAWAYTIAEYFLTKIQRKGQMIIKNIVGAENVAGLKTGAVITCNHFNAFDSFAVQLAYRKLATKKYYVLKRKFFRVIKEGNYTSFPGFYGFLMRNCNTLPLSSNLRTTREFLAATDKLLQKGNYVLVYPEQSMWWNYRKPKPLKKGAFVFAYTNDVPIIPIFITMQDSENLGEDGFPIQEYTIHIGKPIYRDPSLSRGEAINKLRDENYEIWKKVYEDFYQIPLTYTTQESFEEE